MVIQSNSFMTLRIDKQTKKARNNYEGTEKVP